MSPLLRTRMILRWIVWVVVALLLPSVAHAVDPEWASFCERYTNDAVAAAQKNIDLKCGFNGPRWTTNREDHFNWCLSQDGAFAEPTTEGLWRVRGLKDCQDKILRGEIIERPRDGGIFTTPTTTPPADTCTVLRDSDVFVTPGGQPIAGLTLTAGTQQVTRLGMQGANWFHLKWPAGEGWVFSGPGYEDAIRCP